MNTETLYVGPPRSFHEYVAALRLAHDQYVESQYMTARASGLRWGVFDISPGFRPLVAAIGEKVVGTGSLVVENPQGFPSAHAFSAEIQALHSANRTLCETIRFASTPDAQADRLKAIPELIRFALWDAYYQADSYITVVNPKHVRNWQNVYGITPVAECASFAAVDGHPGVFLHMRMKELWSKQEKPARGLERFILSKPIGREAYTASFRLEPLELFALLLIDDSARAEVLREACASIRRNYSEVFRLIRWHEAFHSSGLIQFSLAPFIFGASQECAVLDLWSLLTSLLESYAERKGLRFMKHYGISPDRSIDFDPFLLVWAVITISRQLIDHSQSEGVLELSSSDRTPERVTFCIKTQGSTSTALQALAPQFRASFSGILGDPIQLDLSAGTLLLSVPQGNTPDAANKRTSISSENILVEPL